MSKTIKGNAVVGQSGGPTAVINQSLAGVIEAVKKFPGVKKLLGSRFGVRGIVDEKFIDLKKISPAMIKKVAATPAAALGSTRDKPDTEYCKKIFDVFSRNDVRYFFYIGGNDSADTAHIINELALNANYELRVFHIPKTIDNDLRVTDHCPGFGSAAKFVASAVMGDDRDCASLPGIKIDIVMGRHAGWLTAASMMARQDESDGPHLIYVPEAKLTETMFIDDVAEVYGKYGRCLIAMSEGVEDEHGAAWAERIAKSVERDSHGNVQLSGTGALGEFFSLLVKEKVSARLGGKKLRVRSDTFGYLQRSFAGYASAVDQKEAHLAGRTAVKYAMEGHTSGSVAFRRNPGRTYGITCFRAELKDVARITKPLPREFINERGNGIKDAFRAYALPLTGGLPVIGKLW
ncbi:MAG: 6-phosphofructokinase [Planctomycetes bacterium]|nr:6-phosphofructokinase [Planctomycetota bacterium]